MENNSDRYIRSLDDVNQVVVKITSLIRGLDYRLIAIVMKNLISIETNRDEIYDKGTRLIGMIQTIEKYIDSRYGDLFVDRDEKRKRAE